MLELISPPRFGWHAVLPMVASCDRDFVDSGGGVGDCQESRAASISRTDDTPVSWPTFTTPLSRQDWFDFKAEVDAEKGLLSRLAPFRRVQLADDGLNVFGWYMIAFQGNPSGGQAQGFETTGLNDFGLDFDLEKLAGVEDLSVRISGSWAWGQDLTSDVGAEIPVNAVFSGQSLRFFELYAEQWMLDDTVSLRIGRLTVGWEYGLEYDLFTQYLSGLSPEHFRFGQQQSEFQRDPICQLGCAAQVATRRLLEISGFLHERPSA